ncbi:MAG: hypothetical protein IT536_17035 [Hyphomicrobiales bacterium]|nr:hypothetical protein [Hyphomicrobiales bacterium]
MANMMLAEMAPERHGVRRPSFQGGDIANASGHADAFPNRSESALLSTRRRFDDLPALY